MKVILHLDLDSYFVSASITTDSSLKGKPVVVSTGKRRSIVAAASYEAKDKGVYVPMPFYRAKEMVPEVISILPNYALYTNLSSKVFELISSRYTKNIEVGSIDECYIDATDVWKEYGSPIKLAKHIQETIMKELKLPCSIGIAENKFVAKMSTSINKPYGITLTKPGDFPKVFWDWEVIKFFGIGKSTAPKLEKAGYKTIGDLAKADVNHLEKIIGSIAKSIIKNANGDGNDVIDNKMNDLKGIGNSVTFQDEDKYHRKDVLEILSDLTQLVSHRATIRNMLGLVVAVSIKETGGKAIKAKRKQVTLKRPIHKYEDIYKIVVSLFDELWDERPLKFAGVHLGKLSGMFTSTYQMSFFDNEVEKSKIEDIIDGINTSLERKGLLTGKELKMNIKRKQNQSRYLENDRVIKISDIKKK